jgi:hypothetical protein
MLSIFGGSEKKGKRTDELKQENGCKTPRNSFIPENSRGHHPHAQGTQDSPRPRVVSGRGFDSECAFYGLTASAIDIGADAIIGYQENVAFHPDGSRYFSCCGTAVVLEKAPTAKALAGKAIMQ